MSDHVQLLSAQYLASASRQDHPSYDVVNLPRGPRDMKSTLQSAFSVDVEPYLVNNSLPPGNYNATKNSLHTSFVARVENAAINNNLLDGKLPDVHKSEETLPRPVRALLSQLRSGRSSKLNTYQHFVLGKIPSPSCPLCDTDDHTSQHIFNCPAAPTSLSLIHLWTKPCEVATFLSSLPTFSDLFPPNPPPPLPPPEPPPSPNNPPRSPLSPLFSPLSLSPLPPT